MNDFAMNIILAFAFLRAHLLAVALIGFGCLAVFVVLPALTGLCIHAGMCDRNTEEIHGRRMS
jgi:hypothetical protein